MAEFLDAEVALVDVAGGVETRRRGPRGTPCRLACDLLILADVGGDVLAHGDEPGLASPLCDATMLAAASRLSIPTPVAVAGPGCDAELTPAEVLQRASELARSGRSRRNVQRDPHGRERAGEGSHGGAHRGEPSDRALRPGETGVVPIRGGRRTVELTLFGAMILVFDPLLAAAGEGLPLAGRRRRLAVDRGGSRDVGRARNPHRARLRALEGPGAPWNRRGALACASRLAASCRRLLFATLLALCALRPGDGPRRAAQPPALRP